MNDVLLNKAAIIERCLRRVKEEYADNPARLKDFTHQDAIILNLERSCQAAIDMAMHVVAERHLGIPQTSAQVFDFLTEAGSISKELASRLKGMVGFRNIAVHEYQELNLNILRHVIEEGKQDLVNFCKSLGVFIVP